MYQFQHKNVKMNEMEARISLLYQLWSHKRTFPWMWDHEHYSGNNTDMIGFFYPEDFNTIMQIMHFESEQVKK